MIFTALFPLRIICRSPGTMTPPSPVEQACSPEPTNTALGRSGTGRGGNRSWQGVKLPLARAAGLPGKRAVEVLGPP